MEKDRRLFLTTASSASRPRTISGAWAKLALADPVLKSFSIRARESPEGRLEVPTRTATAFLNLELLVFMQYEQVEPGQRVPLPRPSIDTGMGLERIAALQQGATSVFDIDLFRALIGVIADAVGIDPAGPQGASHRVIADHLRSSAFLVADGVTPSNEGRGYVLRRIMRRAMRHAQMLGAGEPLMLAPRS